MNPETIVELLKRIGELLSPVAQQAYELAYRRALTNNLMWLVVFVVAITVSSVVLARAYTSSIRARARLKVIEAENDYSKNYYERERLQKEADISVYLWTCGIIIALASGLMLIPIGNLINIDWAAIKVLLRVGTPFIQ